MPGSLYIGPIKELIGSTTAKEAKVEKVIKKHVEMAKKELKSKKPRM